MRIIFQTELVCIFVSSRLVFIIRVSFPPQTALSQLLTVFASLTAELTSQKKIHCVFSKTKRRNMWRLSDSDVTLKTLKTHRVQSKRNLQSQGDRDLDLIRVVLSTFNIQFSTTRRHSHRVWYYFGYFKVSLSIPELLLSPRCQSSINHTNHLLHNDSRLST